jgi:SAM-dependent methyltransferase
MAAHWVCGDGECLPFRDESFDTIIVRQGLHHLMKYHAAISEFFRVCRLGGRVLIIDEPFVGPCFDTPPLSLLPDDFPIFGKHTLGSLRGMPEESRSGLQAMKPVMRRWLARFRPPRGRNANLDLPAIIALLDGAREYQQPDQDNSESLLADKYLSLSILSCLFLIGIHTSEFRLFWPDETAWVDMAGETPRFLHGPNPNLGDLPTMLTRTGWMSVAARKSSPTTVFRNRSGLKAIPLEAIPRN